MRWGSLAATDAATDIDATDALVVRVALRDGAVAVLDRETGTVRERLTLDALRGTPDGARVPLRADLVSARTLADGSVVALLALADAVVVRWDGARQPSIWATASSLPPGAVALERDPASGGIVVLGARGALVWLDRFGAVTARADAGPDARALGRASGGVIVLGTATARRVWPDGPHRRGGGAGHGCERGNVRRSGRRGDARPPRPRAHRRARCGLAVMGACGAEGGGAARGGAACGGAARGGAARGRDASPMRLYAPDGPTITGPAAARWRDGGGGEVGAAWGDVRRRRQVWRLYCARGRPYLVGFHPTRRASTRRLRSSRRSLAV